MKISGLSNNTFGIEIPKKPPHKSASEHRRATKPIMEKRRRARINHSLNELKSLILEALNKDPSRHTKLEKADILEMTVSYLQNMQRKQGNISDASAVSKFRSGFTECASEVSRYMNRVDGVESSMKQRVIQHMSNCVSSMDSLSGNPTTAFPGLMPPPSTATITGSSLQVHIPRSDLNNNTDPNKLDEVTPPSSPLFSFNFPPTTNLPLSCPQTPTTPSTPGFSISCRTPTQYHSILRNPTFSPGSISPGSVHSESHDELMVDLKESDQNVWRPW